MATATEVRDDWQHTDKRAKLRNEEIREARSTLETESQPTYQYIPHHFPNYLCRSGPARTDRSIAVVGKTAKKFLLLFFYGGGRMRGLT